MREIVLATGNSGKVREIEQSLSDLPIVLRNLAQFPAVRVAEEDGTSFEENALKKARVIVEQLGKTALADDSGLEVLALNGRPGIHSARFAGEHATDEENNAHLLKMLEAVPPQQRQARFVCVMALVTPEGRELLVHGHCDGEVLLAPQGHGGFGYDPLFLCPAAGKTFAELVPSEKARFSHRGQALCALVKQLPDFLNL